MNRRHCGNCGAQLRGPWCAQCGQNAHASARSFNALLHDGWHTLTHLDSRAWRTCRALLLRPGLLTAEYFAERRQRYLPPVRLYLVLSVLFFALVRWHAPQPEGAASPTPAAGPAATPACELRSDLPGLDALLRLETVQRGCEQARRTSGQSLLLAMQRNVPRMMFVFLPLIAAAMLLLYWRPRRLYLEHLVFCLHNHAALYLVFVLLAILEGFGGWFAGLAVLTSVASGLLWLYVPWYVWRAMRRYYGQGRLLTLLKYVLLAAAYLAGLLLTLIGTTFVSLLQA
ncbi:MAG: DUF3667 domain-containing protein [Gammaproteobacteria bacterium]|nr:DUF3667 domain-containing protein [Gammaproteobacteria bacterium]